MPYGYGASKRYARSMKLKHFVKSAVRGVKSFIVNKAVGNISPSSLVSNFGSSHIATKNIQPIK